MAMWLMRTPEGAAGEAEALSEEEGEEGVLHLNGL